MRYQYFALFSAILFGSVAIAQDFDVDDDDIPMECRNLCQPVIAIERTCDRNHDADSPAYRECVCQAENASSIIPACEACVNNFDRDDDDDDNDVHDIVRACAFQGTTWNSDLATQGPVDQTMSPFTTSTPAAGAPSTTANVTQVTGTNQPTQGSQAGNQAPTSTGSASHNYVELTGLAAIMLGFLGAL